MNLIGEYKSEIHRLQKERDIYRSIAISEMLARNEGMTRKIVVAKIDATAIKLLQNDSLKIKE